MAGEGRAHQLGNSWTGQVAAAGDAAPAILGAYWGCRFYVLGGAGSRARSLTTLCCRGQIGTCSPLHHDYTLPKGAERHATGNYGILENDPGAQGRSTTAHPFENVAPATP